VGLDLCLCDVFEEGFDDVLEGGFENDPAERFEDVVERCLDDDLDEDLDVFECLLAKVGVSETLPNRDWVVLVRL
jgi:hypothetical protein